MGIITAENGPIGGEEAVLQSLFYVALLERVLLRYDLVEVVAGVDGYLVAAVAVVDTEEAQAKVGRGGFAFLALSAIRLEVKHAGVRILHADAPSLHRRDSVDDAVILAGRRFLSIATCTG